MVRVRVVLAARSGSAALVVEGGWTIVASLVLVDKQEAVLQVTHSVRFDKGADRVPLGPSTVVWVGAAVA